MSSFTLCCTVFSYNVFGWALVYFFMLTNGNSRNCISATFTRNIAPQPHFFQLSATTYPQIRDRNFFSSLQLFTEGLLRTCISALPQSIAGSVNYNMTSLLFLKPDFSWWLRNKDYNFKIYKSKIYT